MRDLYSKPEVSVMGGPRGPTGQLIRRMFLEAKKAAEAEGVVVADQDKKGTEEEEELNADSIKIFPRTDSSEYVVRTMVSKQ